MDNNQEINVMEILMQIREDVSSIKTDMANIKNSSQADKEAVEKQFEKFDKRISIIEQDVEDLQDANDKRDAHKWRTVLTFIATAIGGMILAKVPDFLSYMTILATLKK